MLARGDGDSARGLVWYSVELLVTHGQPSVPLGRRGRALRVVVVPQRRGERRQALAQLERSRLAASLRTNSRIPVPAHQHENVAGYAVGHDERRGLEGGGGGRTALLMRDGVASLATETL